jgi:hypothetical protein
MEPKLHCATINNQYLNPVVCQFECNQQLTYGRPILILFSYLKRDHLSDNFL